MMYLRGERNLSDERKRNCSQKCNKDSLVSHERIMNFMNVAKNLHERSYLKIPKKF